MCSIYKTHAKHRSLRLLAMSLILSCVSHANSNEYRRLSQEVVISTHRNTYFTQVVQEILLFYEYNENIINYMRRISIWHTLGRFCRKNEYCRIVVSISWISWPMSFSSSRRMWFREPKTYWSRNMSQLTHHRDTRITFPHLTFAIWSKLTNFLPDYQMKWFSRTIRDCMRNIILKKLASNIQKQFFREFKVSFY